MSDNPTWIPGSTGLRSYENYVNESRKPNQELGKNQFLQMLSTQLQYQDPLEPMKDSDFIAQLAQYSSLEQITNMNTTMSMFQYYNLAGKYVIADVTLETGEKASIPGIVDRVMYVDGKPMAQIGEYLVDATKITQVYDKDLFTGSNPLLNSATLIGRTVTANLADDEGKKTEVSGVVTRVAVTAEEGMIAYLDTGDGEKKVPVANIVDIKQ